MKINTLTKIFGGAIALAAIFTLSTSIVSAYRGDPNVQGPNYSTERHAEMTKAFENHDYRSWSKLMSDKGRVAEKINADNFSDFVKAHELAMSGDLDAAKAIRTKLGLGLRNGQGRHLKGGRGQGNCLGNGQRQNQS